MSKIKIDSLVVLAKLSDGAVRQVIVSEKTEHLVSRLIEQVEGGFKVSSTILHGIEIKNNE